MQDKSLHIITSADGLSCSHVHHTVLGNIRKYRSIAKLIGLNSLSESILTPYLLLKIMRGRWASAALGAGIARRRMGNEMNDQAQAYEAQQRQAQQQIEAQQRQIEALQQQKQHSQPQQEDLTQKLEKYGNLKQQGILTEEEFQKLKADLLSKI
ncbi:MAG TPA: SHOCT domain-containing protein [Nitrososphaeraceae archaeon]|nr:SHOCT domain-containing protein [Nitrososphaeraceae archaeon]